MIQENKIHKNRRFLGHEQNQRFCCAENSRIFSHQKSDECERVRRAHSQVTGFFSEQKREFDFYIFVDYSENLIGYNIIKKEKVQIILPKIAKFRHYKGERRKKIYLLKIKREVKSSNLTSLILKQKVKHIKDNLMLFAEIIDFVRVNDNCLIFMSVDNNQFNAFVRLLEIIPHKEHITVVKESDLKRKSAEHQLSLIIDTMLNIERMSK